MNNYEGIRRSFRNIRLKNMVGGENRSAPDIAKAVDTLIGWAHRDEAAGVRRDRILFDFEPVCRRFADLVDKSFYFILDFFTSGLYCHGHAESELCVILEQ